jgi:hypothetical protein
VPYDLYSRPCTLNVSPGCENANANSEHEIVVIRFNLDFFYHNYLLPVLVKYYLQQSRIARDNFFVKSGLTLNNQRVNHLNTNNLMVNLDYPFR